MFYKTLFVIIIMFYSFLLLNFYSLPLSCFFFNSTKMLLNFKTLKLRKCCWSSSSFNNWKKLFLSLHLLRLLRFQHTYSYSLLLLLLLFECSSVCFRCLLFLCVYVFWSISAITYNNNHTWNVMKYWRREVKWIKSIF